MTTFTPADVLVIAPEIPQVSARRAIVAATIGNALEFYDFLTYSYFAIQIGHAFFPAGSDYGSLMLSLGAFGAGFLTRPFGGLVIGGISDRIGRRSAMTLSFNLMGFAVVAMALIPSYKTIGVAAPVLVVLSRLVMGFALGGEVGPTTAYLFECAAVRKRGRMIAWQVASQLIAGTAGATAGFVLSKTLSPTALDSYGWRIAFLLGGVSIPFGLWVRSHIPETLHVPEVATAVSKAVSRVVAARESWRILALGFFVIAGGTMATYGGMYLTTFAQSTLHLDPSTAFAFGIISNLASLLGVLYGGAWSDRVGRRPIMIWPSLTGLVLAYPIFAWMMGGHAVAALLIGTSFLALLRGTAVSAFQTAFMETLPKQIRGGGFGTVYAAAIAIFGSTCQLILTWLVHATGRPISVAWYLIAADAITFSAMLMIRESAPVRRAE